MGQDGCEFRGKECKENYLHCNSDKLKIGNEVRKSYECCSMRWHILEKLKIKNKDNESN
jgi:hypothetical protein